MARPDFPKSLPEFNRMFREERDCFDFIVQSRWPGDADCVCPSCGGTKFYRADKRLALSCAKCRHIQTATAGTVMHGSRLPLCTWLLAAWLLVTDKRGISAKQMERALGVSYETAYMVLQRLRAAMVNPEREKLRGGVEVDETFVGGVKHGRKGLEMREKRGGKFVVVGAVEVRRALRQSDMKELHRPARVRLRHVPDTTAGHLIRFVKEVVEKGTVVATDGNPSYNALETFGYPHRIESTAVGMPQNLVLEHVHVVFSNLKAWLDGTFHGAVGRAPKGGEKGKHLQGYLNEFSFRFNRRDNLFAAFQTVLGISPKVEAPSYERIYAKGEERFRHVNEAAGRYRRRKAQ
jgi:transposase-like protein